MLSTREACVLAGHLVCMPECVTDGEAEDLRLGAAGTARPSRGPGPRPLLHPLVKREVLAGFRVFYDAA